MLDPARFGLHLAAHLLARYGHLSAAFVTVEQLRWARIGAGAGGAAAEGHKHAFWRDGAEKRFVEVEVVRKADGDVDGAVARVAGGLRDLLGALTLLFGVCLIIRSHALAITLSTNGSYAALRFAVLKSTGSAFENFVRDEYTTLGEVDDRIFSTSVDLRYAYGEVTVRLPRDEARLGFGEQNFDRNGAEGVHAWEDAEIGARAREITMDVFAHDESASVQVRRMRGNEGVVTDNVILGFYDVRVMLMMMLSVKGDAVQDGAACAR